MGLVTQEETEFCLWPCFLIHTPPKPLESLKDMSFVWYGWLWPGGSWIASEWGEGVARGTNQLIRGLAHWPQLPGKVKLITKGNDVLYCACNEASVKKKNKKNKKPLTKRFWEDTSGLVNTQRCWEDSMLREVMEALCPFSHALAHSSLLVAVPELHSFITM